VASPQLRSSPLADGRPDLPWHAVDDLHHCLGLKRQTPSAQKSSLQRPLLEGEDREVH
jgi:hypothetical protein